ncbi:uncharacterized protein [Diabrotica undecimpunctata]|uniref:uncharacterized protein n=1 Tax=Diabrotica undecimpunctata TaxID=50387 RepID=UPI003B638987
MVSYVPKKSKSVVLIFSIHNDDAIDEDTGDKRKTVMITDYNNTKVGVNMVDQLCQNYNVARNTRRWPMVVFYNLLNISHINALCVYMANHPKQKIKRSDFLEKCAWKLIRPQIKVRSTIPRLPREMRKRAQSLVGIENNLPQPPVRPQ